MGRATEKTRGSHLLLQVSSRMRWYLGKSGLIPSSGAVAQVFCSGREKVHEDEGLCLKGLTLFGTVSEELHAKGVGNNDDLGGEQLRECW